MAAVALGTGYSGILMNIINGIIIFIYRNSKSDSTFQATLVFYMITAAFLVLASTMYFVEKRNPYARHYYDILKQKNENRPKVKIIESSKQIINSCKKPSDILLYLVQIYIFTFTVFPGVTNKVKLTFLDQNGKWFQLFFITLFNFCDTIGRYCAGKQFL